MTQVKFCKDCRWFEGIEGLETGYCLLSYEIFKNPINGKIEKIYQYNFIERDFGKCGPEAKYFEKRLSWWERLKEKMK